MGGQGTRDPRCDGSTSKLPTPVRSLFPVFTMFTRFALAALATVAAFSPLAAEARTDSGRLTARVRIPHQCSIDGGHTVRLRPTAGQNNVRQADTNALQLSQNGSTIWTLTPLKQEALPVGSVLNWGSGIGVDFQNRATAPMNIGHNDATRLTANVADNGTRLIQVDGAFSGPAAVLANIDEDSRAVNPHTNAVAAAPLLGGGEYRISTVLRCTSTGRR